MTKIDALPNRKIVKVLDPYPFTGGDMAADDYKKVLLECGHEAVTTAITGMHCYQCLKEVTNENEE